MLTSLDGGIAIKVAGVGVGTWPGLQGVGHGLQCKAEGQETLTVKFPTSAGQPRHILMRVAVPANADKRLTIFNIYTHPTDQPIAHLRGQHPMTAREPPAKLGADSLSLAFSR